MKDNRLQDPANFQITMIGMMGGLGVGLKPQGGGGGVELQVSYGGLVN